MAESSRQSTTRIVVLAAGKGTRMNGGELPKVLVELRGRPIISYLLDAIRESGVDNHPVIVVGYEAQKVRDAIGSSYDYVDQREQLGTGHAVDVTRPVLEGVADTVLVLYGDHPLFRPETIRGVVQAHRRSGKVLTLFTSRVENYDDWRKPLYEFGRIIRDRAGNIHRVVEMKDATDEQLKICEFQLAMSCYDAKWLWAHLDKLDTNNKQKEYYLTDLVEMAMAEQGSIGTFAVPPEEAIGVNTKEHLEIAETLLDARHPELDSGSRDSGSRAGMT